MRASYTRLLERIGRFGHEPITRANRRKKLFVVGVVVAVPLALVVINESRPLSEKDLPPDQLSRLQVAEFKRTANIQTEKTPAGHVVVREISDLDVRVSIHNGTDRTITSFTVRLTGTTADGKSSTRDIHFDQSKRPIQSSPMPTDTSDVSILLEGSPNDFQVEECEIVGARGTSPRGFLGF